MSRRAETSQIDLRELFERGRHIPQQPEAVRARVLTRARTMASSPPGPLQPPPTPPPSLPWHLLTPAAALVLAGGVAATVYAVSRGQTRPVEQAAMSATVASGGEPPPQAPLPAPELSRAAPSVEPTPLAAGKAPPRPRRSESAADTAEFELIRSAHAAYVSHDFANALVLVGQHAQRFPHGLLAEEREALRIRSLLGSGRTAAAERAASAFAKRFPRSVLLPHLRAELGSSRDE
jgi:hypothetical protein